MHVQLKARAAPKGSMEVKSEELAVGQPGGPLQQLFEQIRQVKGCWNILGRCVVHSIIGFGRWHTSAM